MNPAAPTATTGTVPSSQLGGGANGDSSKINGDQVIQNPLSNQVVDQKQAQEAMQIAATNNAQVINNAQQTQTRQAVVAQAAIAQPAKPPASVQTVQQPAGVAQQTQQPPAQQVVQQPIQKPQAVQSPQVISPQPQQVVQQPVIVQPAQPQQQVQTQPPIQQVPPQQVIQQQQQAVQPPVQVVQPVQSPQVVPPQPQQVVQQPVIVQPAQPQQQVMQPVQPQQVIQQPAQQPNQMVQSPQTTQQVNTQQQPQQQVMQQVQPEQIVQQPTSQQIETPQQTVQPQQAPITISVNGVQGERDQIGELEATVANSQMPEELKQIIRDRIARLKLIKAGSGYMSSMYILEYEATSKYLNWCNGLPWNTKTQDILDLKAARAILDKHHFGLEMLKNRMLEFIASIMLNIQNNGSDFASRSPILCFVGLAGTGKTTFAISMAEALGRSLERIPFGGMADSRVLRGQSRYFPDAEPGQIIKRLTHAKARNPVLLLDEIDRVTETARADIMGVLIELLDPEQNNAFADHYIDYPFNLSSALFVATSNNVSTIATAVIDRMEIISMPSYNDEEKMTIGRDFVLPKTRSIIGLKEDQLTIDPAVWEPIIRPLGFDPGVRGLERLINMMCRKAARAIVSGEAKNVRITLDNYKKYTQEF